MRWLINLFKKKIQSSEYGTQQTNEKLYEGFLAFQEGEKLYENRKNNEALNYFDLAIDKGFLEKSYEFRGRCLQELNYDYDAIDDFNQAIAMTPEDCKLYFSRSLSKGAIGDFQGEVDDLEKAIELSRTGNDRNREYDINAQQMGFTDASSLFRSYLKIAKQRLDSYLQDQQTITTASPHMKALIEDTWKKRMKTISRRKIY